MNESAGRADPERTGPRGAGAGARRRTDWARRLVGYALFLGVWQLLATHVYEPFMLPSPITVLREMSEIIGSGQFGEHFFATMRNLAIGFAIAFTVGTAVGIAMGRSAYWDGFFRDYVMLTLTTPGLVFALICAMTFGLSPLGPIVAIVLTSFPHVTVNVVEGIRAIPKDLLDMASAYEVGPVTRFRHVLIPAVAPFLFTAIRYGFAIAWKITALTELFGSAAGVGFQIRTEFTLFSIRGVLAWTLFLVAFALIMERVVLRRIERRFFRWRPSAVA